MDRGFRAGLLTERALNISTPAGVDHYMTAGTVAGGRQQSTVMKLAEALQIRADLQRRIAQMPMRLANNAKVQEGSMPAEEPGQLLDELRRLLDELDDITVRINLANSRQIDYTTTMTALLARREALRRHADIMRGFLNATSDLTPRHTLTEIRVVSTVDVAALRKECDALSKQLRELEIRIQSLNWTIELD